MKDLKQRIENCREVFSNSISFARIVIESAYEVLSEERKEQKRQSQKWDEEYGLLLAKWEKPLKY